MGYKCVIIDDEEMAIKVIKNHLEQVTDFDVVGTYGNPVEAFQALDDSPIDVLFLDIQMPDISGVSFLKMLKNPPLTIFTTAYREYALDGFELEVVDYLLKPIGIQRFLQSVSRLRNRLKQKTERPLPTSSVDVNAKEKANCTEYIFLKTNRSHQKIRLEDVLHIEAIRNHIKVYLEDVTHVSMPPISVFEKQLPDYFIRIHRSFLVNALQITKFSQSVIINERAQIPIGRMYKENGLTRIKEILLGDQGVSDAEL